MSGGSSAAGHVDGSGAAGHVDGSGDPGNVSGEGESDQRLHVAGTLCIETIGGGTNGVGPIGLGSRDERSDLDRSTPTRIRAGAVGGFDESTQEG